MINRKNVNLIFYRPRTKFQKLKAMFGVPVCSMGLLIGVYAYKFENGKKHLQKVVYDDDKRLLKKYMVIDTFYPASSLKGNWEKELLKQRKLHIDRLYLPFRCVKALRPVIDQLEDIWHYRFGDILPSIYLKRRHGN